MFATLKAGLQDQMRRHRNRPFLEATTAASALVALADEELSLSESHRVDQILENLEALSVYDVRMAKRRFQDYADAIRDDAESGRIRALEAISQIAEDAEEVELLVRVCVAVSSADGELHPAERTQIEDICKLLDAEPPDFKAPG